MPSLPLSGLREPDAAPPALLQAALFYGAGTAWDIVWAALPMHCPLAGGQLLVVRNIARICLSAYWQGEDTNFK